MLNVLRVSARSLLSKYHSSTNYNTISDVWCKLTGAERPQAPYKMTHPPLLMRDPSIVLLEFVLLLPNLDPGKIIFFSNFLIIFFLKICQ